MATVHESAPAVYSESWYDGLVRQYREQQATKTGRIPSLKASRLFISRAQAFGALPWSDPFAPAVIECPEDWTEYSLWSEGIES